MSKSLMIEEEREWKKPKKIEQITEHETNESEERNPVT